MRTCFISYQREDKAIADRIYLRLRQRGIDTWMDKPPAPFRDSGIPPGADWDDMILDRLGTCHAFLPVFSTRPVEDDSYFAKELALAAKAHANGTAARIILPVLSGVSMVPPLPQGISFASHQWVDLLEEGLGHVAAVLAPQMREAEIRHEEIAVASLGEFIAAVGSNRTLLLDTAEIDLTLGEDLPQDLAHVSSESVFDGRQLTVHDVENLVIRGRAGTKPHVFVSPRYAFALDLFECRNVRIEGLRLGHHPDLGECAGGVMRAQRTRTLSITDCVLYGCGTQGFEMYECSQVVADRCVIEQCTSALSRFDDCTGLALRDCTFRDNDTTGGLSFANCSNVEVSGTVFENNVTQRFGFGGSSLISSSRSTDVWFRNCRAANNAYEKVEANPGSVSFFNCQWDGFADGT